MDQSEYAMLLICVSWELQLRLITLGVIFSFRLYFGYIRSKKAETILHKTDHIRNEKNNILLSAALCDLEINLVKK